MNESVTAVEVSSHLYPYQEEGVRFLLAHRRRYLADAMGLGKTPQACVAAREADFANVLVIAPASALPGWRRRWAEWCPDSTANILFTSYNMVTTPPRIMRGEDWDLVILDEAHYVKNRFAARTIAALTIARDAQHAWLLSATPMPNHPGELWPPLRALWPCIPAALDLGNYDEWLNEFCHWTPSPYGPKIWGAKNGSRLRPYLDRIMLRRQPADVSVQLPPLRVDVELLQRNDLFDRSIRDTGKDVSQVAEALADAERDSVAEVPGALSRLRHILGELKSEWIARRIAEELDERQYDKIVILAYHQRVLRRFEQELGHYGVTGFDGSTPAAQRDRAVMQFRDDSSVRVFVAQQTAAGTGLDGLQVSAEIVLAEPAWSPDENAQAVKRIHRIGSTLPCRARMFAVDGTLDDGIMHTLARKTRMKLDTGL